MSAPQLTVYQNGPNAVTGDQLNTFVQSCDTAPQMRDLIGVSGMSLFARGMASINDGLQGDFYWNSTAAGPDDDLNTIVPFGAKRGAWVRQSGGTSSVATVANIAALRQLATGASPVWVEGYSTPGDGGEGMFVVGTSASDNGGTVITSQHGTYHRETQNSPLCVRWFGATGNGMTDDTAAIQATVNVIPATGGAVYFPGGAYLTSSTILIPTSPLSPGSQAGGIILFGDGIGISVINSNQTSTPFFTCEMVSGSSAFNLMFKGLSLNANNAAFNAWHVITQNINRVVLDEVGFWSVNPTLTAVAGAHLIGSVGIGDTFYAIVKNCMFEGSSLLLDGVTDSWVTNNVLSSLIGAATGGRAYGVQMTGNCTEIKITGNHIYPSQNGGIYGTANQTLCTFIQGNFFDTNPVLTSAAAIVLSVPANCMNITGNNFSGVPGYCIDATDLSFSTIANNAFLDCGGGNASYHTIFFAIGTTGCNNNVVSGNAFRNSNTLSPPIAAIFENPSSTSGCVYGPNSVSGAGYSAQAITFGSTNGDALIVPWAGMNTKLGGTVEIASGTTSTTFNHSLPYEPSLQDFSLTNVSGWGSATKVWMSTVTATTATISVDVNPGSNITFGYRVEYRGNISDA